MLKSKNHYYNYFLLLFIAGVFVGNFIHYRPSVVITSIGLFILCLVSKTTRLIVISLILIFLGMLYLGFYQQNIRPDNLPFGKTISFQGLVINVQRKNEKQNFIVQTKNLPKNTKIQIFSLIQPTVEIGDLLEIKGQLEKAKKFADFDYPAYLEKEGIFALLYQPSQITIIGHNKNNFLISQITKLRSNFENSLNQSLPEPFASLTAGIILGSKRNLSDHLKDQLSQVGLSHIVAVSGSNLTIIVTILVSLGIGRTIKFRYWALTCFIIFFVILTGASASIVRGGLVAWLSIWARANSRIAWPGSLLLTTILIMILHNPLILKNDLGFQLSTAAFFGLLYLSPVIKEKIRSTQLAKIPKFILLPGVETFAATIPTIPLTAYFFGRISLISILANILVLWTIPIIMSLGFIVGLSGLIQPLLGQLAAQPLVIIEKYLLFIIEITSRIPLASINL